jgi:hypothetical protein
MRLAGLPVDTEEFPGLMLVGGILALQAFLFVLLRVPRISWRAPNQSLSPAQLAARRRVAGPAIGLIVAGLLSLSPLLLAVLAVPAWTLTPIGSSPAPPVPPRFDSPPIPPPAPGLIPLVMTHPHPAAALAAGNLLAPAVLFAQASARMAVAPFIPIIAFGLVSLAFSTTVIVGGWRMRQLKSYGLAIVAAIMAMLPCTFGWILGLPMGIWALVVLMDPIVREGFES